MFETSGQSPTGLFGDGVTNGTPNAPCCHSPATHLWIQRQSWTFGTWYKITQTEVFTDVNFPDQRVKFRIVGRNSTDFNFSLKTGYRYISSATWD